jgi:penicillin-binding protein 2
MKFGSAFSDNVIRERKREQLFSKNEPGWWSGSGRFLLFTILFLSVMFILFLRLFDVTVVNGHYYRTLADANRTKEIIRHAPRGILFDRTGKPLVENVATSVPIDEKNQFLDTRYSRKYLYPEATAHVVGYVNELSARELVNEFYELRGYQLGDQVGRVGAEEVFEEELRGRHGKELVEVDATGNILRTIGRDTELPGEPVTLSLDIGLSVIAEQAFPKDKKGAVIVTKPSTGEILALYSSPSYSPNAFTMGMSEAAYQAIIENPDEPLLNRAIGGVYPPGSTFKLVTALAALEENAITSSTVVEDTGVITMGQFTFPNWYFKQYGRTEGMVDLVKALKRSNDIFFYKVGEMVGITKLAKWASAVGIGKPLGIELPGEVGGLMPDPAWKDAHFQTPLDLEARSNQWYLGDTYHIAIGQGYLLTTPLQVNTWTNVIANGGKLCRPTIEKTQSGKWKTDSCKDINVNKENIDLITKGMKEACSEGGTGYPLFGFAVPVACKTGTAEFGDVQNKTHAWFTVFAPIVEPEISVTVLVEEGGEGSEVAAPIAKKILEEWFGR